MKTKMKTLILIALSALPVHAFACDLSRLQDQAFESIKAENPRVQNVKLSAPKNSAEGLLAAYMVPVNGKATFRVNAFAIDVRNCRVIPRIAAEVEYYNHVGLNPAMGSEVYDNIPSDEPVSDRVGGSYNPGPSM